MDKKKIQYFYKYPLITGCIGFLLTFALTQYLSYKDYQNLYKDEKRRVFDQINLLEKELRSNLNFSLSAANTLGFIEENFGLGNNFDEIAGNILAGNQFIDALELVENGTIKYIFPLNGNEEAIGYDILKDEKRNKEAFKAIEKNEVFFAGPLELKQGGLAIIGRQPINKNGVFWGFAAVIIKLNSLEKALGIKNNIHYPYYIQLSKINPDTGLIENFLPTFEGDLSSISETTKIGLGDWILLVQLKESTALNQVLPFIFLRIIFSFMMGFSFWHISRQPSLLYKKVEEQSHELLQSNKRFEYATMATSDAVWDWDLLTNTVYRSENFKKLFGYEIDEFTGTRNFWRSRIHPEDSHVVENNLKNALENNQEFWEQEFRFLKKDGKYTHVIDKGIFIRDSKGNAIRVIGAVKDISARKKAEFTLEREKEFLRSLLENLSEGIVACDKSGKLTLLNKVSRKIFNIPEQAHWSEIDNEQLQIFQSDGITLIPIKDFPLFRANQGDQVNQEEIHIVPANLPKRVLLCSGEEIKTKEDIKLGAVLVMRDITESRINEKAIIQMGEQLSKRARELELSNIELEQFAFVASHDLQEPLRMISSFLKLLEKKYNSSLDEKGKQYIHFATDGALRMRQIILDLLEYSKAGNAGNTEIIQLDEVMKDLILLNKRLIQQVNADITWDNLPVIHASIAPIRQLFQNLVVNALKYCGTSPKIAIGFKESPTHWMFAVKDNGIGIREEELENIFVIFHRLHSKNEITGTGIGLSICKKIVGNFGGEIWAESELGKGSVFYFTIKKIEGEHQLDSPKVDHIDI